jgi:hypothetical protein
MKKITKITHYWFFKPTEENSGLYFIRSKTDNNVEINWFIGMENYKGDITRVGDNMTIAQKNMLEKEFSSHVSDFYEYLSPTCAECRELITT